MNSSDESQRVTAGEMMSDEEIQAQEQARAGLSPDEASRLAQQHRQRVAEGRARTGEADPNSGQNAHDHGGTIHPRSG